MKRWRIETILSCLALSLLAAGIGRPAAEVLWDGGGDGTSWSDPANWEDDVLPMAGDSVRVDQSGDGDPIRIDVRVDCDRLAVTGADLVIAAGAVVQHGLEVSGSITLEDELAFGPDIDATCTGSLTFAAGSLTASSGRIAVGGDLLVPDVADRLRVGNATVALVGTGMVANPHRSNSFHVLEVGAHKQVTFAAGDIVVSGRLHVVAGGFDLIREQASPTVWLVGSGRLFDNDGWMRGWPPNGGRFVFEATGDVDFGGASFDGCAVQLAVASDAGVVHYEQSGPVECHALSTRAPGTGQMVHWRTNDHPVRIDVHAVSGGHGADEGKTLIECGSSQFSVGTFFWLSGSEDVIRMQDATIEVGGFFPWWASCTVDPGRSHMIVRKGDLGVFWWVTGGRTYRFHDLTLEPLDAAHEVRLYDRVEITGDLVWAGSGTIDPGGSRLVLLGDAAQEVDLGGRTICDLQVSNTSAAVLFASGLASLSGHGLSADPGAELVVAAGAVLDLGLLDLDGTAGATIRLCSQQAGEAWYLDVADTELVTHVDVSDSDASRGLRIEARHSVDGGGNTNWLFTESMQLTLATPTGSYVSPVWMEGLVSADAVSVTVPGRALSTMRLSNNRWISGLADGSAQPGLPLDPDGPLTATILATAGAQEVRRREVFEWIPVLLDSYGVNTLTIRQGDALLFAWEGAAREGLRIAIDDVVRADLALEKGPLPVAFPEPGTHSVQAVDARGAAVGLPVWVHVIAAGLEPDVPAVEVGYRRPVAIEVEPHQQAERMDCVGGSWATVDRDGTPSAGSVPFGLLVHRPGSPFILPRMPDNGPGFRPTTVDEFLLDTTADTKVHVVGTFPDGSRLIQATLTMRPLVPGIEIRMEMLTEGITFEDSTLELRLTSADFTARADGSGVLDYRFIQSPGASLASCHRMAPFQDGVQIGPW